MCEIVIADYDPAWPLAFAEIAARVRAAFTDGPQIEIEHVGSTSVIGLPAKPIVDIDVVIPSRADLPEAIARLATLGYVHQGNLGITSREAFKSPPESPPQNLYVCAEDSSELRRHLLFRDYLRLHPDEAMRYSDLKHTLAQQYQHERAAYSHAKTGYIEAVLAKARG